MLFERFYDAGAGAYDRVFGRVPRDFAPALLRMARVAPGLRVLDIATGTGIVAEAIAAAIGPTGHLTAADISLPMLDGARRRLGGLPNVSFAVEDGQALSFRDGHFDAVVCSLGLMLFPDPARGVAEFRRVLRPGGRFAGSTSQMEPFHARSTFGYTPYGLALLLRAAGLELLEVRPGIDALTLTARSIDRQAAVFGRWFGRDSPANRIIGTAGRLTGARPAEVNAAKLKFCGQFAFLAAAPRR